MRFLPPETSVPSAPVQRRHTPPTGDYSSYRDCLRWEFGFTCAYCLSHEAFLVPHGVEGTGIQTIEHVVPKNAKTGDPALRNHYSNCVLACRFCNTARGTKPVRSSEGARLLDPTAVGWGSHFRWEGDQLVARDPHDRDAAYTHAAYDLDEPRKLSIRASRREAIGEMVTNIALAVKLESELLARIGVPDQDLLRIARELRTLRSNCFSSLRRIALPVPLDAPTECACATTHHHSLPAEMAASLVEVGSPH